MDSARILHIDDDPLVLKLMASALRSDPSLTVTSCTSGEKGLALAAETLPDLILCDVEMPDIQGTELLARLRESTRTAAIPFIFITARNRADDIAALLAEGASAVIVKPFKLTAIAATIRSHLPVRADIPDAAPLVPEEYDFWERLRSDAATLESFRHDLAADGKSVAACEGLRQCAHKLAGAAGIYEFLTVSDAASAVVQAASAQQNENGDVTAVAAALQHLLASIEDARLHQQGTHR